MALFVLVLGILALAPTAAAATPVLFFSDLDWGPKTGWEGSATKGAAVTVWGLNLGASRGTSYITVNGAQLTASTDYAEWGASGPARGLARVSFWLKSSCADGNGSITVTVGGVTSNALPFRIMSGTIYFVSPSGSNSYNGLYSTAQGGSNGPFKDVYMFNPSRNPSGDGQYIVYVRAGTYSTLDADNAFVALRGPYGGDTKRKALIGYPAETPTFNTKSATRGLIWTAKYAPYDRSSYMTFAKLRTSTGTEAFLPWGEYIRIVGNSMEDMRDSAWSGVVMVDNSQQMQVLGNLFKNCGYDSYKHNIYIKTHANYVTSDKSADYITVAWNEFDTPYAGSDNRGGAIFISRASDSGSKYVDHVYVHSNYFHGGNMEFIYTGDSTDHNGDVWVYNNIFRENTNGAGGLFFAWGTRNAYVYNNTFYGLEGDGMISITSRAQVVSKNNIFYSTATPHVAIESYQGATFNSQNDLFYGAATPTGTGITLSGAKSGNPLFVSSSNLHIQSSSPAVSAGSAVSPVTTDYDGVSRPQGGGYDLGAFEYDLGQQSSAVTVAVSPTSVSLSAGQQQQFTSTVTGSTNQAVTWSLSPSVGTLSSSGLYTAPSSVTATTTVTIKAVSSADSTASATATITLQPTTAVTLSMTPASVSLTQGKSQQFTVTVSSGSVPALTWTRSPAVGTLVNGLYTAPASITSTQIITVTATSTANPSLTKSATVTLVPTTVVTLSITPASVSLTQGKSQQFTVTASSGSVPALTWTRSPAVGTLVNGLYTAPASITSTQIITVTATSTANPSLTKSATVTLAPTTAGTLSITPASVSLTQGKSQQFTVTGSNGSVPALTWTRSPAVGTIVNGVYTAPSSITATQTVTITATSSANPSLTASAVVTLTPQSQVSVSVSPQTASLGRNQTAQFAATVTGTTATSVNWSIQPVLGTISASGIYTAPSTISAAQTVTVRATLASDATKYGNAVITLIPPAAAQRTKGAAQ